MDRRQLLTTLGTMGACLPLAPVCTQANHGEGNNTSKMMAPVGGFHLHFCGIHVAKHDPKIQIIAQHYCGPNGDMHQCLLFDSVEKGARLIGVEYIISDEEYRKLPESEKKYWHPHTYEVLAGGLIAPGMKPEDEMTFMKAILTTWGKTWHTWPDPTTKVPMGEPMLMWSAIGDGQIDDKLIVTRDKQFGVKADRIRELRCKEIGFEVPQVSFPKTINDIGRQWTDKGDDKPNKKK